MNKADVTRIYLQGWTPATDFVVVKPNHIIIEPIKPDEEQTTAGGLHLPGQEVGKIPGTAAYLYRIVLSGYMAQDPSIDEWVSASVGDVITVRNALIDPLHTNLAYCICHRKHVLTIVKRAA